VNNTSRVVSIVSSIGGLFAIYFTMFSMGVFSGFETKFGYTNVAQLVFMSLVVILAVAIAFEVMVVLKKPRDLIQNLQSGIAKYTGATEHEVGRLFGDVAGKAQAAAFDAVNKLPGAARFTKVATNLIHHVPVTAKINQIATQKTKKGKYAKQNAFEVQVDEVQYPAPAELLARLRATFASLPLKPAQVVLVNQVSAGTVIDEQGGEIEIVLPEPASPADSTPMAEYVPQRNRRSWYFVLGCAIAFGVIWGLSIYF